MIICSIIAVILSQQAASGTAMSAPSPATGARLADMTRKTFDQLDADKSSFLEHPESPFIAIALLNDDSAQDADAASRRSAKITEPADPSTHAIFYSEADQDGDGKVSYAEYHQWSVPRLAQMGLDLVASLKPES